MDILKKPVRPLINCMFLIIVMVLPYVGRAQTDNDKIRTGAEQPDAYLPRLEGKRVALVANHSALVGKRHLLDVLIEKGVEVVRIFTPEHGFRGTADAGKLIANEKDEKTGLPIVSLYSRKRKPAPQDLADVDVVVYDIQDVGVRFYTYITTMHHVMEACAENRVPFLVLDRPNPNGFYVDGPMLGMDYKSFVGIHPVPMVHGMTVAEYARMINGEGWLNNGIRCELDWVSCKGYDHSMVYAPLVPPSPNLPNLTAILLYPSLGLFEGTVVSIGRGTDFPFQAFGHPDMKGGKLYFTPQSTTGARNPKLKGRKCRAYDLRQTTVAEMKTRSAIELSWLLEAYKQLGGEGFFNSMFNLLVGNGRVQEMIREGATEEQIRASWKADVDAFMPVRANYLLYPDYL